MRDTQKILRAAIYNALNGTVNVGGVIPVFDEARPVDSTASVYILLSTQQEVAEDTDETFITKSFIDIEVCQNTESAVSKDKIDDIGNEVLTILFPTAWSGGITQPSLMQIQNLRRDRTITRALEISPTKSILRKIITLSATMVQQF